MTNRQPDYAETPDDDDSGDSTLSGASSPAKRSDPKPRHGLRVVTSASLLGGAAELAIVHNEATYFLRQTRLGKLILTK